MTFDPTYPLLPVFSIFSAALLAVVLISSTVRQSWNIGISVLCFWVGLENLVNGVGEVIWRNNADIKLEVWCDIVSHVQMFTFVVKPACTLVITRRLYQIASLRSVQAVGKRQRRKDVLLDLGLVLGLPTLVTGGFYYIVQGYRFQVLEGFGCENAVTPSWLAILLVNQWLVTLPSISVFFYCPKIIWTFYRHSRETNQFLNSNGSVSRNHYFRILALGVIDTVITLPVGILSLVQDIQLYVEVAGPLPFYQGWVYTHTGWDPLSVPGTALQATLWDRFDIYFAPWSSVILALAIFALFGLTAEARAMYWRAFCAVSQLVGWMPLIREDPRAVKTIEFGRREINLDLEEGGRLSFVAPVNPDDTDQGVLGAVDEKQTHPRSRPVERSDSLSFHSEYTGSSDGHSNTTESHSVIEEVGIKSGRAAASFTTVEKEGLRRDGTKGGFPSSTVPEDAPGLSEMTRTADTFREYANREEQVDGLSGSTTLRCVGHNVGGFMDMR